MFVQNITFTNTTIGQFMHKVYAWMCIGLLATALTSYSVFLNPQWLYPLLANGFLFMGLIFAQFGLVIFLTSAINKIRYSTGAIAFFVYSVLTGITLTPIFLIYTMSSIALTFGMTSAMFGSMALYGYYTDTDLSKLGSILLMGLWGLMIAMLVNWYFQSSQMEYLISCAAIVIFTLLTAYDVQKIKRIAEQSQHDFSVDRVETTNKIALFGALTLYLDFINLFLHLLRVMGKKRR